MNTREQDFKEISSAISSSIRASSPSALLAEGDSLSIIRKIPSHSVSVILTDPPYHSTKKHNIYGDRAFAEDQQYLEWMAEYAIEWKRILKPNGSLFCFCASEMAARLEIIFSKDFNILSQVVWTKPNEPGFDGWKQKMKKESLRQWYPHTERIIFAEPACEGNLHRSPFANLLKEIRKKTGISTHSLCESIGAYGRVNHGGAVSNWEAGRNIPSREQYEKICVTLLATGKIVSMPPYEDAVRPFMVDSSKEFTDVWTFPSVRPYKGKHPAEKPTSMLEQAIEATSFPGDIVLDCFAGSGSTALAALELGRSSISIEIDEKWIETIANRLELQGAQQHKTKKIKIDECVIASEQKVKPCQSSLFSLNNE
ncbi:MAG: site-specific DNA-methyltransferase [Methylococcaceae bacterium]